MAEIAKTRPKHLNLFQIRLPLPGVASILHRVSGFGLFLFLPFLIWLLDASLRSVDSFASLRATLAHPFFKLISLGLTWALLHHLCMGIRILLIDIHVGVEKAAARRSALAVFVISLTLTLVMGVALW